MFNNQHFVRRLTVVNTANHSANTFINGNTKVENVHLPEKTRFNETGVIMWNFISDFNVYNLKHI